MGSLEQKPSRVHLPTLGLFLTLLFLTAVVAAGLRWAMVSSAPSQRLPAAKSIQDLGAPSPATSEAKK